MKEKKWAGFSLIEMTIVVAIIGILAAIAYPSYVDYIRKTHRSDGMDKLLTIQNAEEKWRSSHSTYGTLTNIALGAASARGYYNIVLSVPTASGFVATATGQGDQANDKDGGTTCTLVLTVSSIYPRGDKTPTGCWD